MARKRLTNVHSQKESSDDERRDVVCRSILNEVSKGSPTPYTNQLKLEYPNLNWETLEDYTLNVAYVDKLKQLEQKVGLTFAEFDARESIENKFIKTIKDLVVWMERWLEYVAWGGDDRLGQGGFDASHATHFSLRYPLMVSIKRDENAMLALEKQEQMK